MSNSFLVDNRQNADFDLQLSRSGLDTAQTSSTDSASYPLIESLKKVTRMLSAKTNASVEKKYRFLVDSLGITPIAPQPAEIPVMFKLAKGADDITISEGTGIASSQDPSLYFETKEEIVLRKNSIKKVCVEDNTIGRYFEVNATDGNIESEFELAAEETHSSMVYKGSFLMEEKFGKNDIVFAEFKNAIIYFEDGTTKNDLCNYVDIYINNTKVDLTALDSVFVNSQQKELFCEIAGYTAATTKSFVILDVSSNSSFNFEFRSKVNLAASKIMRVTFPSSTIWQISPPDKVLADGKPVYDAADAKEFILHEGIENFIQLGATSLLSREGAGIKISLDLQLYWQGFLESKAAFKTFEVDYTKIDKSFFGIDRIEYFDGLAWVSNESFVPAKCIVTPDKNTKKVNINLSFDNKQVPLSKINGVESRWLRFRLKNNASGLYTSISSGASGKDYKSITIFAKILNSAATRKITSADNGIKSRIGNYDIGTKGQSLVRRSTHADLYFEIDELGSSKILDLFLNFSPQNNEQLPLKVNWYYLSQGYWAEIKAEDGTLNFKKSGRVILKLGADAAFDPVKESYVVKCRLFRAPKQSGESILKDIKLLNVFNNYVAAISTKMDSLPSYFSSTGDADQSINLGNGTAFDFKLSVVEPLSQGTDLNVSSSSSQISEWIKVDNFYLSGPEDRHYVTDYFTNTVFFGNGKRGKKPPKGSNNIMVSELQRLLSVDEKSAINLDKLPVKNSKIKSLKNVGMATGQRGNESEESFYSFAPMRLSHLGRAVTATNIENMIIEAFTEVVSCKSFHDKVTLKNKIVVVPKTLTDMRSNNSILKEIKKYVLENSVSNQFVCEYPTLKDFEVKVILTEFESDDTSDTVKEAIRQALENFFSPVTGGQEGSGWKIGRDVYKSEISWAIRQVVGRNLYKIETTPAFSENSFLEFGAWEYPNLTKVTVETNK